MGPFESFQSRLEEIIRRCKKAPVQGVTQLMRRGTDDLVQARQWLQETVIPRLRVLAGLFPHNVDSPCTESCGECLALGFRSCREYPIAGHFCVYLAPDNRRRSLRVFVRSAVQGRTSEASTEVDLLPEGKGRLAAFVEDRMAAFVADYLGGQNGEAAAVPEWAAANPS